MLKHDMKGLYRLGALYHYFRDKLASKLVKQLSPEQVHLILESARSQGFIQTHFRLSEFRRLYTSEDSGKVVYAKYSGNKTINFYIFMVSFFNFLIEEKKQRILAKYNIPVNVHDTVNNMLLSAANGVKICTTTKDLKFFEHHGFEVSYGSVVFPSDEV